MSLCFVGRLATIGRLSSHRDTNYLFRAICLSWNKGCSTKCLYMCICIRVYKWATVQLAYRSWTQFQLRYNQLQTWPNQHKIYILDQTSLVILCCTLYRCIFWGWMCKAMSVSAYTHYANKPPRNFIIRNDAFSYYLWMVHCLFGIPVR